MKLYAISDLHLSFEANRQVLAQIPAHPEDWLILAGDTGETIDHLDFALRTLVRRFCRLIWVPGNHDLWTTRNDPDCARGCDKYDQLVALCRSYRVITPEDPYPVVKFGGREVRIVPLFLLYDYSFRPAHIAERDAISWAREAGIECTDEMLLHPDPYPSRIAWCHARCEATEARLEAGGTALPTVLVNHFPLLERLVRLPRIPRFSLWCGTRRTADWHRRFGTELIVYGHLHTPSTRYIDGIRCEEVSLGYPRDWIGRVDPRTCLRAILV